LLGDLCCEFREGRLGAVAALLAQAGDRADCDAACLNLRGVMCEALGEVKTAKRYYGKAMRADPRFAPALQNMRRLYELQTFGATARAVAVGEAFTDLWLARRTGRGANP
jgi:Flp pilus assembly protein TadD